MPTEKCIPCTRIVSFQSALHELRRFAHSRLQKYLTFDVIIFRDHKMNKLHSKTFFISLFYCSSFLSLSLSPTDCSAFFRSAKFLFIYNFCVCASKMRECENRLLIFRPADDESERERTTATRILTAATVRLTVLNIK